MIRWQYAVVNVGTISAANRLGMALAYLGRHGWELVSVYDKASNWIAGMEKGFLLFKRPVPPGEEPEGPWAKVWTSDEIAAAYKASKDPSG